MKSISLLVASVLVCSASAQTILPANTSVNNGGGVGWGLFFDLTAAGSDITVTGLSTGTGAVAGDIIEIEVFTFVGAGLTGVGNGVDTGPGSDLMGWTSLGLASGVQGATSSGISEMIDIPDILVPAGQTVGVALVSVVGGIRYFGQGANPYQTFADSDLTLTTGDSRTVPFTQGGLLFASRGLGGEIEYTAGPGGVGTNYCGPGVPNSTGNPGVISGSGSSSVASNNLSLTASSLPTNSFGFFVVGDMSGFVPNPAGSSGNLCVGGAIGRYVGPGQIQFTGMSGEFSLALDLTDIPRPNGPVAGSVGDTWFFQAWHRDSDPMGGATSNFTDALEVLLN